MTWRATSGSAGFAVVVALGLAATPPSPPSEPSIEVVEQPDVEARTFKVRGEGWIPDTLVQLELCGNEARNGSTDCLPGRAQIVAADAKGIVRGRVSSSPPPVPCPCVIRAYSLRTGAIATARVRVAGAAEVPRDDVEAPEDRRELSITTSIVDSGNPWAAWFGAAPERTVILRVENTGPTAVDASTLSLTIGRSEEATGFVAPVNLGAIDVGETKEFRVPVDLPAFAFGDYVVRGELSGTTEPTTFVERTSAYPWLLLFIPALVVLQFVLLKIRDAIRRRATDTGATPPAVEGHAGDEPPPELGPGARALPPPPADPNDEEHEGQDGVVYVVEVNEARAAAPTLDAEVRDRILHEHRDERTRRVVYTVLGERATRRLVEAVTARSAPDGGLRRARRGAVDVVSIPPIVTLSTEEAEAAGVRFGEWLGGGLGLPVYLASRRDGTGPQGFVRVGGGPDFGADDEAAAARWIRLESGVPSISYRIVVDDDPDDVDRFVRELQLDGILALSEVLPGPTGSQLVEIRLRVHDLEVLTDVQERVTAGFHVMEAAPVGLLPLRMIEHQPMSRLERLGIGPESTIEYQILSVAETRRLEAAPRRRELAVATA